MQRSLYASGYSPNGNLGRSSYPDTYSPTRSKGQNYSSSFISELEKHHDRSLQIANDRLKSQEIQHDRNIESLRSQISSLRQQLEHNEKGAQREETRLEEDFSYRLNILSRESEAKLRPILAQINDCEKDIERSSLSNNSELRNITKSIQDLKQENHSLRPKIEVLNAEVEKLRKRLYEDSQQELAALEKEKSAITRAHHSELEQSSEGHRRNVNSLHSAIDNREGKIEELQRELGYQKKTLSDLIYDSNDEIRSLEENLQSARNLLSRQERDMSSIHMSMNEAKKEMKILNNEKLTMDADIDTTKQENEYLKQEIKRLERLVYGKGSPRRP